MAEETLRPKSLDERLNSPVELAAFDSWRHTHDAMAISQGLGTKAVYDADLSRWMSSGDAELLLKAAVEKYAKAYPEMHNPAARSWDALNDNIKTACAAYEAKGDKSFVRRLTRKQDNFHHLNFMLEAIPTDNGIGLIKGGLAIVFHAVLLRISARQKIFACFESIPRLIERAVHVNTIIPNSDALVGATKKLFQVLTESIGSLINVLLRQTKSRQPNLISKATQSFSRNPEKEVDKIIGDVTAAKDEVELLYDEAYDGKQAGNWRQTMEIGANVRMLPSRILSVLETLLKQKGDNLDRQILESIQAQGQSDRNHLQQQQQQAGLDMMNSMSVIIQEQLRKVAFQDRMVVHHHSIVNHYYTSPGHGHGPTGRINQPGMITEEDVISMIGDVEDHVVSAEDMSFIMRQYHHFSDVALAKAAHLLETPEFNDWISNANSEALVVDGHCRSDSMGSVSPLSILSVLITQNLRQAFPEGRTTSSRSTQPGSVVLFFACGLHYQPNSPLLGPVGMILSFISSLIIKWPSVERPRLDFLSDIDGIWAGCRHHEIQALCNTFELLVEQLPLHTRIYCMIDGFSQFQTVAHGWDDDLEMVMGCLQVCMENAASRCHPRLSHGFFKVLATSRDKSHSSFSDAPLTRLVDLRGGRHRPPTLSQHAFTVRIEQGMF